MKNKLKYLIQSSLRTKIKTKWFLIANITLAILLMGIVNIDSIIEMFGGDFEKDLKVNVLIEDESSYEILTSQLDISAEAFSFGKKIDISKSVLTKKEEIEAIDDNIILVVNKDLENVLNVEIISKSYMDTIAYQTLLQALNSAKTIIAMNESGIDISKLERIYTPITAKRTFLDEDSTTVGENMEMIMSTIFPVFILPFFFLTVLLIQFIGTEINTEKATKGMEIIISNVSPKTHLISKVVAVNLFVALQGFLLLVYTGIGLLIRSITGNNHIPNEITNQLKMIVDTLKESGVINTLAYLIPLIIILMIITLIGYALLSAILASMTTNNEDYQQMQMPLIILSLAGYYLSIMAGIFKDAVIIKILSYFPFVSALLAPSLLIIGQATIIDFLISVIIMILTCYLLIKFGLRIYKVGILNYSSSNLWKKVISAAKNK